jgi:hypothetical protein
MQYLVAPFCSVCQEILVKTIHDKSNPFIKTTPEDTKKLTADSVNKFVVKLAKPSPNTLSVKWYLNDQLLTANVDSIYINKATFKIGENIIKAEVTDTTDLVRAPGYHGNTYSKSWHVEALKDYDMEIPLSTWGDTLETCFDGYQALSVSKPQAGVSYAWYATAKTKKAIAKGANWVSPRLKDDKVYYLEATYGKKKSPRKAILVKVAQQIQRPLEINVSKSENKIKISINDKDIGKYNIEWYTSPHKFHSWGKNTVEIPAQEGTSAIYFKMVDKITTCKSEMFKIEI